MSIHTNLVCMCCGHIQPVQRDQLPSRCEHCRESFTAHGYFLDDFTTDAEEVSHDILDTTARLCGSAGSHCLLALPASSTRVISAPLPESKAIESLPLTGEH